MKPGMWYQVGDKLVCCPMKCGSTSLQAALVPGLTELSSAINIHVGNIANRYAVKKGFGPYSAEQVSMMDGEKVLCVREPVSRFRAIWQDVCREFMAGHKDFGVVAGKSPDEFIRYIKDHPEDDPHWIKQSDFMVEGAHLVPIQTLFDYIGLPNVHVHKSEYVETSMPEDKIKEHYHEDVKLYEDALCFISTTQG